MSTAKRPYAFEMVEEEGPEEGAAGLPDDPPNEVELPGMLTTNEVAAWLRFSPRTLDRHLKSGTLVLPRTRFGQGPWRYSADAVHAEMDARMLRSVLRAKPRKPGNPRKA